MRSHLRTAALLLGAGLVAQPASAAPVDTYDRLGARLDALDAATTQIAAGLRAGKVSPGDAASGWRLLRRALSQIGESVPASDAEHAPLLRRFQELSTSEGERLLALQRAGEAEQRQGAKRAAPLWQAELAKAAACTRAHKRWEQALSEQRTPKGAQGSLYQTWPARIDGERLEVQLAVGGPGPSEDAPLLRLQLAAPDGTLRYQGPEQADSPLTFGTCGVDDGDITWAGLIGGQLHVIGCFPHGDVSARWRVLRYERGAFKVISRGFLYQHGTIFAWRKPVSTDTYEERPFFYRLLAVLPDGAVVGSVQTPTSTRERWAHLRWASDGLHLVRWLVP